MSYGVCWLSLKQPDPDQRHKRVLENNKPDVGHDPATQAQRGNRQGGQQATQQGTKDR